MNGILNLSIHFNVVHRKVDWRNPKMKSLNSMPDTVHSLYGVMFTAAYKQTSASTYNIVQALYKFLSLKLHLFTYFHYVSFII